MNDLKTNQGDVCGKKKGITSFLLKVLCFCIPFFIVLFVYFKDDPFMVLRKYTRYDQSCASLNESYVCWQNYLNNKDSIPFDSFILGNSCTMAFKTDEWKKYINSNKAIRLYGNSEGLAGVCRKLKALDARNAEIKNVLLVLDASLLKKKHLLPGYINVLPPEISGISELEFQMNFLQAFLYPDFLISYLDYKMFHQFRPRMNGLINPYGITKDPVTNDAINPHDKEIEKEKETYWIKRKKTFPPRSHMFKETKQVMFAGHIQLLKEIKNVCEKHKTNLKILISPDYNQENLHHADVQELKKTFGSENVFDFSGINEYTTDIHNYYEPAHYRPVVGAKLLKLIYSHVTPK